MEMRGRTVHSFLSSKIWFVKGSTLNIYNPIKKNGLPAFISAPVLVNILWLSNPSSRINFSKEDVSEIGITKLISSTLDSSMPSQSVLKRFDNNLSQLVDKNINITDCVIVASKMAEKELIMDLNKTIEENLLNPEVITKKINDYKNEIEKKDQLWRNEIKSFLEKTATDFTLEKAELQIQRQNVENQNAKLLLQQTVLKDNLISIKVNVAFRKWQHIAYLSLIGTIISITIIVLTFTFIDASWNIISNFYDWADTNSSIRKEFMIKCIIELFFIGFSTLCIHTIINRWFNKKAKHKKRNELIEEITLEINKLNK